MEAAGCWEAFLGRIFDWRMHQESTLHPRTKPVRRPEQVNFGESRIQNQTMQSLVQVERMIRLHRLQPSQSDQRHQIHPRIYLPMVAAVSGLHLGLPVDYRPRLVMPMLSAEAALCSRTVSDGSLE